MPTVPGYIYLHGFASSPRGAKASFFQQQLQRYGRKLIIPDLNGSDFSRLTMSAMIHRAAGEVANCPSDKVILLASSLGAMVALNMLAKEPAELADKVVAIFLMAPCFDFMAVLVALIGEAGLAQWRSDKRRMFYHYGEQRNLPLHFHFVEDLAQYDSYALTVDKPVSIVHGNKDGIVPISQSERFAARNGKTTLLAVDSDHGLLDVEPLLWQEFCQFAGLPNGSRE